MWRIGPLAVCFAVTFIGGCSHLADDCKNIATCPVGDVTDECVLDADCPNELVCDEKEGICLPIPSGGGDHAWSLGFGVDGVLNAHIVAVDSDSNIIVAGGFEGTIDFGDGALQSTGGTDVFLVKHDVSGAYMWSKRFGGVGGDVAYSVAVDSSDNVIVAGYFSASADFGGGALSSLGATDVFVAKYDSTGNHMWSRGFGGSSSDVANSVAVDANDDILVAGNFRGVVSVGPAAPWIAASSDVFVAKYAANGDPIWNRRLGGDSVDHASSIVVDADNHVHVTGYFYDSVNIDVDTLQSVGAEDGFVAEYDSSGNYVGSMRFGGPSHDRAYSIAVDGNGDIFIAGYFEDAVDFGGGVLVSIGSSDVFVAKYDGARNLVWSRRFGGPHGDTAKSVAVDNGGNVLVAGYFQGSMQLDGNNLASAGRQDLFVVKYDAAGDSVWGRGSGGLGDDSANAVAVDGNGNVLVVGYYRDTINFGGGTHVSIGLKDGFLLQLTP